MQIVSPPLALGQAVHEVIESLSVLPTDQRFHEPLLAKFERAWKKVSGRIGGFQDIETEARYKSRGEAMIKRVVAHPGPLKNKSVKIKEELPQFTLSEEDNIILCGKIDWLEYLPETDSVHIIDFKTSRSEEDPESLQLPIYHLLVHYCQKRAVTKASYWYLEMNDALTPKELPNLIQAQEKVLKLAKQVKLARQFERFKCPEGQEGCKYCRPFEMVLRGEGTFLGVGGLGGKTDLYLLESNSFGKLNNEDSVLL